MEKSLLDEIRQTKPFSSLEQEAFLALLRTAAELEHGMTEVLRPHGITPTQYNVLRILRGAGAHGLCRNAVRDRMVAQVPDATRLLDRMEAMRVILRERDSEDRRFVTARITDEGLRILSELDAPVLELHRRQFDRLDEGEVRMLIELLGRLRCAE